VARDNIPAGVGADAVIARIQAQIRTILDPIIPNGPLAMVDYPDYANVGDSAIWLGQVVYLNQQRGLQPHYCCSIATFDAEALKRSVPEGPILICGGGNFGTLWPHHQDFRLRLMELFPKRPIIQMPQSMYFSDEASIDETARAIDRHGAVTLLVRDERSLALARAKFNCAVHLCPDMAFYVGATQRLTPSLDVLCLLRSDSERVANMDTPDTEGSILITDWLRDSRLHHRLTKVKAKARALLMGGGEAVRTREILNAVARSRFRRGVETLSQGKVVVTDRLHAHILSLLLDIPHVALDNAYGKLGGFIEAWTHDYRGLQRATRIGEAIMKAKTLI
jgi:pyruvyl transferase EpsO